MKLFIYVDIYMNRFV